MLKDMNFVKRLTSCEIMGDANNICPYRTGTLTKNIMTDKKGLAKRNYFVRSRRWKLCDVLCKFSWKTAKIFLGACAWNTNDISSDSNSSEMPMIRMLDNLN